MSKADEGGDYGGADGREIHEAAKSVEACLQQMGAEMPNPSGEVKRSVAVALRSYRNVLRPYRNDDALETEWSERPVDLTLVDRLLNETTTSTERINRRGSPVREVEVQLVKVVDPDVLEAIAQELHDIKHELGFRDETADSRHRTEISDDLLREVEQWRKQNLD